MLHHHARLREGPRQSGSLGEGLFTGRRAAAVRAGAVRAGCLGKRMTISSSSAQDTVPSAASAATLVQIDAPLPGRILLQEKKRCV